MFEANLPEKNQKRETPLDVKSTQVTASVQVAEFSRPGKAWVGSESRCREPGGAHLASRSLPGMPPLTLGSESVPVRVLTRLGPLPSDTPRDARICPHVPTKTHRG